MGEILIIYSHSENKKLHKLYWEQRDELLFVNKSRHESVHDDLVAFLKVKFAMHCYQSFLP